MSTKQVPDNVTFYGKLMYYLHGTEYFFSARIITGQIWETLSSYAT